MQKDGTPFDATSVLEEDILEMCVTLGTLIPWVCSWYLATELVALFCTTEEMQWASHGALKVTELWDEPIAFWVAGDCTSLAACTPSNPQPTPWGEPSGSGNTNRDDQEVTFQEGEGGFPWDNQLQLQCDQVEVGSQEPPPQPLRSALANPDVGHLINTLASGLHLGTPRINTFSGKATPGKTEVSFKQWCHKVQCIKGHYPESVVQESIVWSLKGAAADMAWYMGPTASVTEILQKLMVIFGTVASFDVLMQNFYKVTQGNHEKVPSFATRLEGTLNQVWLNAPEG